MEQTEIKCPQCSTVLHPESLEKVFRCTSCGEYLMEEEAGPGFSIIGVVSQSKETEKPVFPMDDPIADDYTRWQLISILSILLGGVLAYLSASAVIADLDPINPFDSVSNIRYALEVIGGFLSITFLAGGIFGFRRIGRAIKRYEEEILGISE